MLAEIHRIHGAEAKIVECNRLRVAAVAGLFARQEYEVFVEKVPPSDWGDPDRSGFDELLQERLRDEEEADEIRLALVCGNPDDGLGSQATEAVCDNG